MARSDGISWPTNDRRVLSYRIALTSAILAKAKHVLNFRLQHTFPLTPDYVRIGDTGDQQSGSWAYILTSNSSYVTFLSVSCLPISFPIPLLLFLSLLYTLLTSFPKNQESMPLKVARDFCISAISTSEPADWLLQNVIWNYVIWTYLKSVISNLQKSLIKNGGRAKLCGEYNIDVTASRFLISVGGITSKNMQIMLANSFIKVKEEHGDFAKTIFCCGNKYWPINRQAYEVR